MLVPKSSVVVIDGTTYLLSNHRRSACEAPERAMSLVSAASLVTSEKYSGLVSLVRTAAEVGLGGGDCSTL